MFFFRYLTLTLFLNKSWCFHCIWILVYNICDSNANCVHLKQLYLNSISINTIFFSLKALRECKTIESLLFFAWIFFYNYALWSKRKYSAYITIWNHINLLRNLMKRHNISKKNIHLSIKISNENDRSTIFRCTQNIKKIHWFSGQVFEDVQQYTQSRLTNKTL